MRQFPWRVLFILGFIPLGLPVMLWLIGTAIAASAAWLIFGPDQGNDQDRLDRWMDNRVTNALDWPLDKLMRKAGVLRELWM